MSNFWLQDEDSNTLDLDNEVTEITFGQQKRNYKVEDFIGIDGGAIRGFGTFNPRKFKLKRNEYSESGDNNFFNSRRTDFLQWATKSITTDVWLYVTDGEGSNTYRTLVYCLDIGNEKSSNINLAEKKSFTFISPKGIFENTTATTGSSAITSSTETDVSINNSGILETPAILDFTPSASCTLFQCTRYDTFGFRLEGSFSSGTKISIDTSDGSLTIGGVDQLLSQYLTAGNLFKLPIGTKNLKIYANAAGTFDYSYNTRVI